MRLAHVIIVAVTAAALVGGLGVFLTNSGDAAARPDLSLPAAENIAALARRDNVVPIPLELRNLAIEERPSTGDLHLLSGSIYAWQAGGRVCTQDGSGNGGCFVKFRAACNCTVADPDGVGRGKPVYVSGIVPDGVRSIAIVANSIKTKVAIDENSFSYSFDDATIKPWDVTGAEIVSEDGSVNYVHLGNGIPPKGLE